MMVSLGLEEVRFEDVGAELESGSVWRLGSIETAVGSIGTAVW